jgi:hypothetical protein
VFCLSLKKTVSTPAGPSQHPPVKTQVSAKAGKLACDPLENALFSMNSQKNPSEQAPGNHIQSGPAIVFLSLNFLRLHL